MQIRDIKTNMPDTVLKSSNSKVDSSMTNPMFSNVNENSDMAGLEIQRDELSQLKEELSKRLKILNTSTVEQNERFGKDGIDSILLCVQSKEDIALVNQKLDEIEQGAYLWTYDITKLFGNRDKLMLPGKQGMEINPNSSPDGFMPMMPVVPIFKSPAGATIVGPIQEILTEPSTNPEVLALEGKMKEMGYSAYFSDNLETAKIITNAYKTMTEKGFKLPKEVLLMTPAREGIMGFRPYAATSNKLDTPILFNKDLANKGDAITLEGLPIEIKYNATDSPESVVYHEMGHVLHEDTAKDYNTAMNIWKYLANDGFDIDLAKEVGFYAMTGDKFNTGREYVAEVFAGLMDGKHYSERVMKI